MSKADYPTLISTLKARRSDLENNSRIKLDDLGLVRLMASCESRTANPGHFTNNDYSVGSALFAGTDHRHRISC